MPPPSGDSPRDQVGESALILRAQLGDRSAISSLIGSTVPWLRPYLHRLLPDPNDADDVLQESLLVVYRRLPLLAEPRAYRAWAYRIASRIAFKHAERRWPITAEHTDLPASTVERANPDEIARVVENISALSPNIRAAVALHYYEQLSIRQVAAVLDIPEGTAKSRIAAGLEALRRAARENPP